MTANQIRATVKQFIKWGGYDLWSKPFERYINANPETEELYFKWWYVGEMPEEEVVSCINQAKGAIVVDLDNKDDNVLLGHSVTKVNINNKIKGWYYLGAGGTGGGGGGCGPNGCQ